MQASLLASIGPLAGCASDDIGQGSVDFAVSGGMALEQGFPHVEGSREHAFIDGWSLQFTEYVVAMGQVKLTDPEDDGSVAGGWDGSTLLDLRADGGKSQPLARIDGLPARRLDLSLELLRASAAVASGNVDAAVAGEMRQNGWTFYVTGQATREGRTVGFQIGLDVPTHLFDCINGKDGTKGLAIEAEKTVGVYIYPHPHHLFWDTLAAGGESLRFDAWAAVAGPDELVTEAELATQDLTDLHDENGDPLVDEQNQRVYYDSGTALRPDELNLLAFVRYAARASVHFNGVGLCNMRNTD